MLACAALLPDRVERAICDVGVAPLGTPGLEQDAWLAGMDPENVKEFGWALAGEDVLTRELQALQVKLEERAGVDPSTVLVDPLVALSAAAASTKRIRLATGIYLLPLRPPLITARMTCTLHDVSRGRFLLGVGVSHAHRHTRWIWYTSKRCVRSSRLAPTLSVPQRSCATSASSMACSLVRQRES